MLKKIIAILLAILSFNLFFYKIEGAVFGNIAFLILTLTAQAFLWISFYPKKFLYKQKLALSASALAIFASLFSLFRASEVDHFLLNSLTIVLTLFTTYLLTISHHVFGAITELLYIPKKIADRWFNNFFSLIPKAIEKGKQVKSVRLFKTKRSISSDTLTSIFRGIVITLPIILIITFLLTQADPVFSTLVENLLNIQINWPNFILLIPERLIYSVFIALILIPISTMKIENLFVSPLNNKIFVKYKNELSILVLSLVAVLSVFIAIQFRYLFATVPETQLHQFGINTYSEYVRKGFVEMVLVSIIVYLVSSASFIVYRSLDTRKNWLRRFNFLLLAEMLIFIISIFRRVVLYQSTHGLTRIRVYGLSFLIVLIGLTITLALRQLRKKFSHWYLYELAIVMGVLFMSVLINTDKLVATTFRPTVNKEVDYIYISRLSADAVDGWIEAWQFYRDILIKIEKKELESDYARQTVYTYLAIRNLNSNYIYLTKKYGNLEEKLALEDFDLTKEGYSFTQFNFGEWQAYQKLKNKISYQELKQAYQRISDYYLALPGSASSKDYDRSMESPLLR